MPLYYEKSEVAVQILNINQNIRKWSKKRFRKDLALTVLVCSGIVTIKN